jgi:hypothetical protein
MSDDDSSKKIASSKDFETTINTEDVTNADLLSLFKTYMNFYLAPNNVELFLNYLLNRSSNRTEFRCL